MAEDEVDYGVPLNNHTAYAAMERRVTIQNGIVLVGTVVLILGLYAMGAGWWSAFGSLLLLKCSEINYIKHS